jgi:hypothetical protein
MRPLLQRSGGGVQGATTVITVRVVHSSEMGVITATRIRRLAARQRSASGDDMWRAPLDCARSPSGRQRRVTAPSMRA